MAKATIGKFRQSTATRHKEQLAKLDECQAEVTRILASDSNGERVLWMEELEHIRRRLEEQRVAVLAKGGDRVENLAWRLSEQTLDATRFPFPRLESVIVSIGLNNLGDRDASNTPEKIMDIVHQFRTRFPTLPIYVLALPNTPLGEEKGWNVGELNSKLQELCATMPNVVYTFPWQGINAGHYDSIDKLHLTRAGYDILFENLAPILF